MLKRLWAVVLAVLLLSATVTLAEGSAYTLLDPSAPPEALGDRVLSDDEIQSLANASLDELREKISTFADYTAWAELALPHNYTTYTTSNPEWQVTMGAQFHYQWLYNFSSSNGLASVAQYVLEDDYPGIVTVAFFSNGGSWDFFEFANAIPMDGGWYVLGADDFMSAPMSTSQGCAATLPPMFMTDLAAGIEAFATGEDIQWGAGSKLLQIFRFDTRDEVVLNLNNGLYVPTDATHLTVLYEDAEGRYPDADSRLAFETYGFPAGMRVDSDIDAATARALMEGTVEDAAAAIHTIPDLMNYLYYSGYEVDDGDLSTPQHDMDWHYNYKPNVVFARRKGNCGGTSGLAAWLLAGDFDQVGFCGLIFEYGEGHVINWFKDGDTYYVCDFVHWVSCEHEAGGLCFCTGSTLNEAAMQYCQRNGVRCLYTYTNESGDMPVGWSDDHVTHLPNGYGDNVNIVLEDAENGYTYAFVDISPNLIQGIDLVRGEW